MLMGKMADVVPLRQAVLGRRSSDRGSQWFCNVGGIEFDGATPLDAVQACYDSLLTNLRSDATNAERDAVDNRRRAEQLADLT